MRPKLVDRSTEFKDIQAVSSSFGENKDCSVVAVSIVLGIDYAAAHALCAAHGRKPGRGMHTDGINNAVRSTGALLIQRHTRQFIDRYPAAHQTLRNVTTHHPDRFKNVWADGKTYLFYPRGHVLAVKNGTVHDWTRGKAKRVLHIYEVVPAAK